MLRNTRSRFAVLLCAATLVAAVSTACGPSAASAPSAPVVPHPSSLKASLDAARHRRRSHVTLTA